MFISILYRLMELSSDGHRMGQNHLKLGLLLCVNKKKKI